MNHTIRRSSIVLFSLAITQACSPAPSNEAATSVAPSQQSLAAADYERAERFLGINTTDLVHSNILAQYWQDDDRLIYRRSTENGSDYILVDVQTAQKSPLFDTARLATQLAAYAEEEVEANDLSLSRVQLGEAPEQLEFDYEDQSYVLDLSSYALSQLAEIPTSEYSSPDDSMAAFIDEHNLWVRDTASNEVTQLTFDGEQDYGYATNNAGWLRDDGPVLLWSPDSSKIATFRHDGRNVGEMYLWSTQVGHGELDAWKYPLPGDDYIFMIERIVVHLEDEPRIVTLNMSPDLL